MKRVILSVAIVCILLLTASPVLSGDDFDLVLSNIDLHAEANLGDFKASIETRFDRSASDIDIVFGQVPRPADAYLCLRIASLANRSVDAVLSEYRKNRKKGWGVIAKNLGIKPGSKAFHALKENPFASRGEKDKKGKQGKKG